MQEVGNYVVAAVGRQPHFSFVGSCKKAYCEFALNLVC